MVHFYVLLHKYVGSFAFVLQLEILCACVYNYDSLQSPF